MSISDQRIERILAALANACCGNFDYQLSVAEEEEDLFQSVEIGFNTLLNDLAAAKANQDAQLAALTEQAQQLQENQRQLVALAAPITLVWPQVVLMPIIGVLDVERSRLMAEALLQRIMHERAKIALIDLTGVGRVDLATAQSLLRLAASVRLLGSDCIFTGLSHETAKSLAQLPQELALRTLPSLADALMRITARPR